jgi:hypothetical protein
MDEAEWMECAEPQKMLKFLGEKASDRKMMQFSAACLRRIWHLLTDDRSRNLVEVTERFLDGTVSEEDADRVYDAFSAAYEKGDLQDGARGNTHEAVLNVAQSGRLAAVTVAHEVAAVIGGEAAENSPTAQPGPGGWVEKTVAWESAAMGEKAAQTPFLRDIFGSPFRPVALDPAWRTPPVVALATAAYEERILPSGTLDPDRLAVLADALEESGCDNADILDHLRGPGEHVRGCWVVDLLLGKE